MDLNKIAQGNTKHYNLLYAKQNYYYRNNVIKNTQSL